MAKQKLRIQHTILIWMIVLTIIPIAVVSFQGFHCARQALIETQNAHLQTVLSGKAAQVEQIMDVVRSDLHLLSILSFSGVPEPEKGCCESPSCTCNPLSKALGEKAYYNNLVAFGSNWKIKGSARPLNSGNELPEKFRKSLESASGLVFSGVVEDKNGPKIVAGCPLTGQKEGKRGFITGTLNIAPIIRPILSNLTGIGKSGRIILISRSGKVIQLEKDGVRLFQPDKMTLKMMKLPKKTIMPETLSFPGTGKLLVESTVIPTLGWRMFLVSSYSETFRWLNILKERAIITGIIVFIFVLFAAARMAVRISAPLKTLAKTANSIASGQISTRVPSLSGKEAADVADAFNRMMDKLSRLQQKLAHSASLAAIGELSSSIVHEMRNPLSSVKMNLQALREKVKEDPDYRELSEIALSQTIRLENMLTELLGYGKPMKIHKNRFKLHKFLESCVNQSLAIATEKNIQITTELPENEVEITADKELLSRAIVNLLRNGIEAGPEKTTVKVLIRISRNRCCFTITDQGPGIPPAISNDIFKPFVTGKDNGTGLGLANVRKIARLHGGTVTAKNMEKGGACFQLCIPQEEAST
ncbi:MAG: HAMP domain-containing protein [Acidobacteria bacterium]|nr:HAMP domain-containing protein [Acidobacteriota bacterium]